MPSAWFTPARALLFALAVCFEAHTMHSTRISGSLHWQMELRGLLRSYKGFKISYKRAGSNTSNTSVLLPTTLQDRAVYTQLCRM